MAVYTTLNEDNFRTYVLESKIPVLVDFWATWCGPCRALEPVIEEIARDFSGKARVGKLDVDHNPGLAAEYGVRAIPTLLFFQGGQIIDRVAGFVPKESIAEKLDALLDEQAVPGS